MLDGNDDEEGTLDPARCAKDHFASAIEIRDSHAPQPSQQPSSPHGSDIEMGRTKKVFPRRGNADLSLETATAVLIIVIQLASSCAGSFFAWHLIAPPPTYAQPHLS